MNLLEAWKESFTIFKPKQLNLFLLVTLKSIKDAYALLLTYWWWLYLIIGTLIFMSIQSYTYKISFIIAVLLGVGVKIVQFLIILATRPSIQRKTFAYFIQYLSQYWYLLVLLLVFSVPWAIVSFFEVLPLLSIAILLFVLFVLDTKGTWRDIGPSLLRTAIMLLYNLPLWLIVYAVFFVLHLIIGWFVFPFLLIGIKFGYAFVKLVYVLFLPVEICLVTNIYIKKLHEQSDLYFPQP